MGKNKDTSFEIEDKSKDSFHSKSCIDSEMAPIDITNDSYTIAYIECSSSSMSLSSFKKIVYIECSSSSISLYSLEKF